MQTRCGRSYIQAMTVPEFDRLVAARRAQSEMAAAGVDALVLGGTGAVLTVSGIDHIATRSGAPPYPSMVLRKDGLPYVTTPDPDGAEHLGDGHVFPICFNPMGLMELVTDWLGPAVEGVVAIDALAPEGVEMLAAACPRATFVDATPIVHATMSAPDVLAATGPRLLAASAGAGSGIPLAEGAFLLDGVIGYPRWNGGDRPPPSIAFHEVIHHLVPDAPLDALANTLPPGAEFHGVGCRAQWPVVRAGRATPAGARLHADEVLYVRAGGQQGAVRVMADCPPELLEVGPDLAPPTLEHDRPELLAARRARLDPALDAAGVDVLVLTQPGAVRQVTGVWRTGRDFADGLEGGIVALNDEIRLDLPPVEDAAFADAILDVIPTRGRVAIDRVGVDSLAALRAARPDVEFGGSGLLLAAAGGGKAPAELAVMREGSRRTERAMAAALAGFEVGMSERDLTTALVESGAKEGLTTLHIDNVFAAMERTLATAPGRIGPWTGRAPWRQLTTRRVLAEGDLIAVDAGFIHEGYATDFGATYVVGRDPDAREQDAARRWEEIADRVTDAIRPGATGADLCTAALNGWADENPPWPVGLYVAHGLGFGTVEPPFAGTDLGPEIEGMMVLEPGMVFMLEPFVWDEGYGGYRAERCVAVTDDGAEIWSELPVSMLTRIG